MLVSGRNFDRTTTALLVTIVVGLLLQVAIIRWFDHYTLWWIFWRFYPGASGLRGLTRFELLVTLAMAASFSAIVDRVIRSRRQWAWVGATILVAAGAIEQAGRVQTYSAAMAEGVSRRVGDALARDHGACRAAYVIGTPGLVQWPAPVDAAHFDAQAYLAANPDVAASWSGTPWQHYELFGRAERRSFDPVAADRILHLTFFYNYTVPLAAVLSGIPVVNGLSGWQPPGWSLAEVLAPEARDRLAQWLAFCRVPPEWVCVLPVRLQLDMLPDVPGGMFP